MLDNPQSSAGITTRHSGVSVGQTIDRLRRLMADRGFTVFNVIDHSGVAERAGVQMPESKLIMFGKPTVGAAVMVAVPLAALDIPLKVLVWEDRERSCISQLQLTKLPGGAAPPGGFPASAIRLGSVDR